MIFSSDNMTASRDAFCAAGFGASEPSSFSVVILGIAVAMSIFVALVSVISAVVLDLGSLIILLSLAALLLILPLMTDYRRKNRTE